MIRHICEDPIRCNTCLAQRATLATQRRTRARAAARSRARRQPIT